MNVKEAYSYSVSFLQANNVDEADFKALSVVCYVAGIKNSEYYAHKTDFVIMKRLADCLWRLKTGEPLQYIIGKWDFYESEFYVGEGVLIPRPETEELVDLAVKHLKSVKNPIVIDLCSGSGCIGISIAKAVLNSKIYCIEKSKDAFKYLEKNAEDYDNVILINEDIFNDIDIDIENADLIISNPPYIKTSALDTLQNEVKKEPKMALDGGSDGLDFYRIINNKWSSKLKPSGELMLEIGEDQGQSILDILTEFKNIEVKKDMYGNYRMVVAKR